MRPNNSGNGGAARWQRFARDVGQAEAAARAEHERRAMSNIAAIQAETTRRWEEVPRQPRQVRYEWYNAVLGGEATTRESQARPSLAVMTQGKQSPGFRHCKCRVDAEGNHVHSTNSGEVVIAGDIDPTYCNKSYTLKPNIRPMSYFSFDRPSTRGAEDDSSILSPGSVEPPRFSSFTPSMLGKFEMSGRPMDKNLTSAEDSNPDLRGRKSNRSPTLSRPPRFDSRLDFTNATLQASDRRPRSGQHSYETMEKSERMVRLHGALRVANTLHHSDNRLRGLVYDQTEESKSALDPTCTITAVDSAEKATEDVAEDAKVQAEMSTTDSGEKDLGTTDLEKDVDNNRGKPALFRSRSKHNWFNEASQIKTPVGVQPPDTNRRLGISNEGHGSTTTLVTTGSYSNVHAPKYNLAALNQTNHPTSPRSPPSKSTGLNRLSKIFNRNVSSESSKSDSAVNSTSDSNAAGKAAASVGLHFRSPDSEINFLPSEAQKVKTPPPEDEPRLDLFSLQPRTRSPRSIEKAKKANLKFITKAEAAGIDYEAESEDIPGSSNTGRRGVTFVGTGYQGNSSTGISDRRGNNSSGSYSGNSLDHPMDSNFYTVSSTSRPRHPPSSWNPAAITATGPGLASPVSSTYQPPLGLGLTYPDLPTFPTARRGDLGYRDMENSSTAIDFEGETSGNDSNGNNGGLIGLNKSFRVDSIPEHLPSSPLCPRNPKHPSGGKGFCPIHGANPPSPIG